MMKPLLLCLFLGFSASMVFAQNNPCPSTFVKTLGAALGTEFATGLCEAPDGNLYFAGGVAFSSRIMKITPEGTILWSVEFDISPSFLFAINEIKVDSDGKIFGCGVASGTEDGFVFRFDPDTKTMLWFVPTDGLASTDGVLEKKPGGNYIVFIHPQSVGAGNLNARLVEYNRVTGEPTAPLLKNYQLGTIDRFASLALYQDTLYACGMSLADISIPQSRQSILKLDLDGNQIWSVIGHVPLDQPAQLVGRDILIDNNSIITITSGDDELATQPKPFVFLQKAKLDGSLEWVKKFDLTEFDSEFPKELLNLPDGYLIFGRNKDLPSNLFFLKTDKNGNLIWSKKVDYPINYGITSTFGLPQSQAIIVGNNIYAAVTCRESNGNYDILLVKMDLNGVVGGDCPFVSNTAALALPVLNAVNTAMTFQVSESPELFTSFMIPADSAAFLPLIERCSAPAGNGITDTKYQALCPGQSISIGGADYTAPATVLDTIPGINGGCDSIITYVLTLAPLPARDEIRDRCPGEATIIDGIAYFAPDTVVDTIPAIDGACDTVVTYILTLAPVPTRNETRSLCPGEIIQIGGVAYAAPNTVLDTIPSINGACDTIVTYALTLAPQPTRNETRSLCPGETIQIGGVAYTAPNTVLDTIPSTNGACDTIVTYTLTLAPQPTRNETRSLCPGETIQIGGVAFSAPNTVLDTIPSTNGACDTIITYILTLAQQPTRNETRSLCQGEIIQIGGVAFSAPNTVLDTIPSTNGGCDTIVTYTLLLQTFPQPSSISVTCPPSVTVSASNATVNFPAATAATDCVCGDITLIRNSGLPSGSTFPIGVTEVCYRATDLCGTTKDCCFLVTVNADPTEPACDVKTIGCVKFELLGIQQNPAQEKTYRVRVTNNCSNTLTYAAFQLPDGLTATYPANNATYITSGGRSYTVRNPNDAPFHSIRFKSLATGIAGGQSDIFSYTLPQQADPTFILSTVRLEPQLFYEAHLNTFNCPVQHTGSLENRTDLPGKAVLSAGLRVFPNPSSGLLHVELPAGSDHVEVLNAQGAQVFRADVPAGETALQLELPAGFGNGLYFLRVSGGAGHVVGARFVLER
jgi:outer membrane protein assembly factor BamB